MSQKCAAFMCNKTIYDGVWLFKFPKNYNHNWIFAVDRGPTWTPKQYSRLCSDHFLQDAFIVTDNKTKLKEGSEPLPGKATSISEEDKIVMKLITEKSRQEELISRSRMNKILKEKNPEVWSVIEILKKMEQGLKGYAKLVTIRSAIFDPLSDIQVVVENVLADITTAEECTNLFDLDDNSPLFDFIYYSRDIYAQKKLGNYILHGNNNVGETGLDFNISNLESEADTGPIRIMKEDLGASNTANIVREDVNISIINDDTLLESDTKEEDVDINNETIKLDIDEIPFVSVDDQHNIKDDDNIEDNQDNNVNENKPEMITLESAAEEINNGMKEALLKYKPIKPRDHETKNLQDITKIKQNVISLYPCEVCGKIFTTNYNLKTHKDSFHTGEPFACDLCGKAFSLIDTLETHKRVHKRKPFACDVCGKAFSAMNKLIIHQKYHRVEKPFACNICEKAFKSEKYLADHKRYHNGKKPLACDVCGRTFSKKSILTNHLEKRGTNHLRYSCNYCELEFSEFKDFTLHKQSHTFECDVCNKKLCNPQSLRNHKKKHEDRIYTCSVCEKIFTEFDDLTVHRRIHKDEKNDPHKKVEKLFACDICGKTYASMKAFDNHKIFHTDGNPYVCDICGKNYSQLVNLQSHKVVHTGEMPFHCKICDKRFSRRCYLNRHKDNHRPKIPCSVCKKEFKRRAYYLGHLRLKRCKPVN